MENVKNVVEYLKSLLGRGSCLQELISVLFLMICEYSICISLRINSLMLFVRGNDWYLNIQLIKLALSLEN